MAWGTPLTAAANAALTAAQWNASVRDNLNETAVAKFTTAGQYFVATALNAGAARIAAQNTYNGGGTDTTNSTTYTALTGGAEVTVTTGTAANVFINAKMSNNTAGARSVATFVVSGASTVAASDIRAVAATSNAANEEYWVGGGFQPNSAAGMVAGSNTFTMQFKVSAGTGSWTIRSINVVPW